MNKLSICMIVRNEAEHLAACLKSLSSVSDELIVVDTGSTDETVAIAEGFDARIIRDPWRDDFSYSRNKSLDAATCPWIAWFDADDILKPEDALKIIKIKNEYKLDTAFGFQIKNPIGGLQGQVFNQIRMFPNRPEIRFEFRVHEQVLPAIQRLKLNVAYTDIFVMHTGYDLPETRRSKQKRNLLLLEEEIKLSEKDHPVIIYMMAGALIDLGKTDEAIPYFERAYAASIEQKREKHIGEAVPVVLAKIGLEGNNQPLYDKWISIAKTATPDSIQLHLVLGLGAERANDLERARDEFEMVLSAKEKPSFIPVDYAALKIQACARLGKLYGTVFKNKKRMLEILETILKLQGKEPEPLEKMGERYFNQKEYSRAAGFYKSALERNPGLGPDVYANFVTCLRLTGLKGEAFKGLEVALGKYPDNASLCYIKEDMSKEG